MGPGWLRTAVNIFVGGVAVVAFGGWAFAAVEHFATRMMAPWSFRIGPRVLDRQFSEPDAVNLTDFAEPRGMRGDLRFRRLGADSWLFHVAPPMSFRIRFNTPLPLKGTLRVVAGRQLLEGRAPLGPLVFFGSWLVGWCAGSIGMAAKAEGGDGVLRSIAFGGLGVVLVVGMAVVSLRLERRRLLESLCIKDLRG